MAWQRWGRASRRGFLIGGSAWMGSIGLGVFIDNAGMINHSGVNWGFRAIYVANPRKRGGKVVMSNGENGEALNAAMLKRF
ncbi:MAG: hypothetical protein ACOZAM_28425 [Pseudomonadota bacterium]